MPGVTFARTPPEPYPRRADMVAFRQVTAGSGRNTALPVHSHDDEADGDARGSGSAREHSDHDGAQPDHHPGGNDGRGAAPCTGSEPPDSGAHQKRPGGLGNTGRGQSFGVTASSGGAEEHDANDVGERSQRAISSYRSSRRHPVA